MKKVIAICTVLVICIASASNAAPLGTAAGAVATVYAAVAPTVATKAAEITEAKDAEAVKAAKNAKASESFKPRLGFRAFEVGDYVPAKARKGAKLDADTGILLVPIKPMKGFEKAWLGVSRHSHRVMLVALEKTVALERRTQWKDTFIGGILQHKGVLEISEDGSYSLDAGDEFVTVVDTPTGVVISFARLKAFDVEAEIYRFHGNALGVE